MVIKRLVAPIACAVMAMSVSGYADSPAPPSFELRSGKAVFTDFESVSVAYTFDYSRRTASAEATIKFRALESGYPIFDLVPNINSATLNGEDLRSDEIDLTYDPDRSSKFRVVQRSLAQDSINELKVTYNLSSSDVTYSDSMVRVGFFTSDLDSSGRGFFEQYGPSNFEYDQYKTEFSVKIVGTKKPHIIYANGSIKKRSDNDFTISYPSYFTASSLYFHLAGEGYFQEARDVFEFEGKQTPIVVYSTSSSRNRSAVAAIKKVMLENSQAYGPYAHDVALAYITSSGGGMEYCGATITSAWALEHEFTHFWFARGVMPANGNSGWIDEAIASWRDDGYRRASRRPSRSPVNMGGFSPYRRHTSRLAYDDGEQLMREFDYIFREKGGLKPLLKTFFYEKHNQTFTLERFKELLEDYGNEDFTPIFNRYVKGKSQFGEQISYDIDDSTKGFSHHPVPFTKEQLRNLR